MHTLQDIINYTHTNDNIIVDILFRMSNKDVRKMHRTQKYARNLFKSTVHDLQFFAGKLCQSAEGIKTLWLVAHHHLRFHVVQLRI